MKRFIIIILCITLILSAFSISVFADTNKESKYFKDVSNYQWAVDSIDYLYEIGLISGVVAPTEHAKGEFNPSGKVTKAEFATIIYNLTGKVSDYTYDLKDVAKNSWYYTSVISEYNKGILEADYITNKVYPNNYVSREECFYMIYKVITDEFKKDLSLSGSITKFSDYREVSTVYYAITDALVSNGYISGSNGKINPKSFLTRAETAVIVKCIIDTANLKFNKINFVVPNLGRGLTGNGYDGVVSTRKYSDDIITIMTNFVANEVGAILDSQIGNVKYYNISSLSTFDHPTNSVKINCHDLHYIQACVARNAYEYYGSDSGFRSWVRNYCDSRYDRTTMQLIRGSITKEQWEDCRQDVIWALNNYRFPKGVIVADKVTCSMNRGWAYTEIYAVIELYGFGNNGYSYNPNTKNWVNQEIKNEENCSSSLVDNMMFQ